MRYTTFIIVASLIVTSLSADEPMPNVPTPTAGGLQLWSDHRVRDGFRVQQNALTGRWRLIDQKNVRLAWGDKINCLESLDQNRPWIDRDDDGRCVTVLLHGLGRSRHSMRTLAKAVVDSGAIAVPVGYSSTRREVPDHAMALQEVIADWPTSWTIRFIGHSMGNIVVRHWIADRMAQQATNPAAAKMLDRCESMVMLGPPNQGSSIAKRLGPTGLFGFIVGNGGMQMGPRFDAIQQNLATPPFPFAVIAGDVGHFPVGNPLLDGPNDLIVTVEETKLDGMAMHRLVPVPHTTLMTNADSIAMTLELLNQL